MRAGKILAAAMLLLLPAGPSLAEVKDLALLFAPAPGTTWTYALTESETAALGDSYKQGTAWKEKIALRFGDKTAGGIAAQMTISDVTPTEGKPDTLHYLLARALENKPLDVVFDLTGGYISDVTDWPAVKAGMIASLGTLTDPATVTLISHVLDQVDPLHGATVVAQPLGLLSGAYALTFRSDLSDSELPDWQGGSSYIFPGRKAVTHLRGMKDKVVYGEWRVITDPQLAAERVGGEILSLLTAASLASPAIGDAARQTSALLSQGGLTLEESAGFAFDTVKMRITRFRHELTVTVGAYRKDQTLTIEATD